MSRRTRPVGGTGKRLLGAVTVAGAGGPAVWAGAMHLLTLIPPSSIESVTAVAVLGVGLAVALWYVLSSALAAVCLVARLAGPAWCGGEALVRRTGPRAVRRLLGGGAGAALVASSLLVPAHAEDSGAPQEAGAGEPHLTWAPPAPARETTGPAGEAGVEAETTSRDAGPDVVEDRGVDDAGPDRSASGEAGGPGHDGADPPPPPESGDTQESPDVQEKEGRGDDDPDAAASEPETPAPEAAAQEGTGEGGGPSQAGNAGEPGAAGTGHVYLVQPGDTLWHVAAGALGESATDAEIAAAWPQWYQANIDIIGPDPDLIHPGQELAAPGGSVS